MSVLHICCNLAGSTVFPQLFEALDAQKLEQIVFVPEKRAVDLNKNEPRGVKTVRAMTVKQSDALFFFRKAQRSVPAIEKQIDLSGVTLIHAHTLFTDGSIAERLAKKRGLPYVVTLRYSDLSAIWKYEPHLRPMARRILRGAARVVCLGGAAREKVLGWFSGAARDALDEKLHVIPNGIDPAWLDGEPRTAPHAPVRVGFAGRMNERKHPLDALNAALDGLEGCVYKPIALLGTQIVAGTNYCFLCETTVVVPDAQPGYALVYVFDGLEGEHELLRVQEIEFSAFE